jgi:hypothetical protein
MRFEFTTDYGLVRSIMTNPRIYHAITDDFSPKRENFLPLTLEGIYYLLVWTEEGILLGLFMLVQHSPVMWEAHTCLLPAAWGHARGIAKAAARFIWNSKAGHQVQRLITAVPEPNRLALHLALDAGWEEYGRNKRCILRGGVLQDEILLGLSRPEEPQPCPQQ